MGAGTGAGAGVDGAEVGGGGTARRAAARRGSGGAKGEPVRDGGLTGDSALGAGE